MGQVNGRLYCLAERGRREHDVAVLDGRGRFLVETAVRRECPLRGGHSPFG